ncbi:uncharacterized protein LOC144587804 isoform X1 [Pogona vitticeps]
MTKKQQLGASPSAGGTARRLRLGRRRALLSLPIACGVGGTERAIAIATDDAEATGAAAGDSAPPTLAPAKRCSWTATPRNPGQYNGSYLVHTGNNSFRDKRYLHGKCS